jgi:hypothetical protein
VIFFVKGAVVPKYLCSECGSERGTPEPPSVPFSVLLDDHAVRSTLLSHTCLASGGSYVSSSSIPQINGKGKAMKLLSCALLLMASMAFVLLGCSDNSTSPSGPIGQSAPSPSAMVLAKEGPVVRSVTGSSLLHFTDEYGTSKIGTLTIAAKAYEGGAAGGTYNWVTFRGQNYNAETKWGGHGEVISVTMYPNSPYGNAAVICGHEREKSSLAGQYLAWFVVDNGEGGNAAAPDLCSEFVVSASPGAATMTPEQIYASYPYFYVSEAGNIAIH